MQNLGSFRPLGAILGAPSHTKLDFAIPLYIFVKVKAFFLKSSLSHLFEGFPKLESFTNDVMDLFASLVREFGHADSSSD